MHGNEKETSLFHVFIFFPHLIKVIFITIHELKMLWKLQKKLFHLQLQQLYVMGSVASWVRFFCTIHLIRCISLVCRYAVHSHSRIRIGWLHIENKYSKIEIYFLSKNAVANSIVLCNGCNTFLANAKLAQTIWKAFGLPNSMYYALQMQSST